MARPGRAARRGRRDRRRPMGVALGRGPRGRRGGDQRPLVGRPRAGVRPAPGAAGRVLRPERRLAGDPRGRGGAARRGLPHGPEDRQDLRTVARPIRTGGAVVSPFPMVDPLEEWADREGLNRPPPATPAVRVVRVGAIPQASYRYARAGMTLSNRRRGRELGSGVAALFPRPFATTTALDALVSEADFQAAVLDLARLRGWRCYHTHDSRRSAAGYPDLTLVRGRRLLFVELKRRGGRPTPAQAAWLADLAAVPGVEVHLWRPADWPAVESTLR